MWVGTVLHEFGKFWEVFDFGHFEFSGARRVGAPFLPPWGVHMDLGGERVLHCRNFLERGKGFCHKVHAFCRLRARTPCGSLGSLNHTRDASRLSDLQRHYS